MDACPEVYLHYPVNLCKANKYGVCLLETSDVCGYYNDFIEEVRLENLELRNSGYIRTILEKE
jgi:hypothetical protein